MFDIVVFFKLIFLYLVVFNTMQFSGGFPCELQILTWQFYLVKTYAHKCKYNQITIFLMNGFINLDITLVLYALNRKLEMHYYNYYSFYLILRCSVKQWAKYSTQVKISLIKIEKINAIYIYNLFASRGLKTP